ncbi:hypothetical protein AUP74_00458 [Microbulbifer aggregans]|uniref:DUF6314 domain-containing protein n=1 Tax=Microbulbifer aggregans TaxID=1769779 RepID=A0A1C9W444_9GAMM|nr:DUF6314 family protein [Microbulbifer aggregans]AOS95929.1 hypothetical protein AUP74_00458 [Microbulbifer aggregans]
MVDQKKVIEALWSRLAKVTEFSFTASNSAGSATDWHGHGRGKVAVSRCGDLLLFEEEAQFTRSDGRTLPMRNRYRWGRLEDRVRLEHQRREDPVLLFELAPVTVHGLRQVTPHLCGADTYTADLLFHGSEIELIWAISGPRKAERLHYHYW